MVEIIERGIPLQERKYKCTCRNCSTSFRFARSEATLSPDSREPGWLVINCPICGTVVMTSVSDYEGAPR